MHCTHSIFVRLKSEISILCVYRSCELFTYLDYINILADADHKLGMLLVDVCALSRYFPDTKYIGIRYIEMC